MESISVSTFWKSGAIWVTVVVLGWFGALLLVDLNRFGLPHTNSSITLNLQYLQLHGCIGSIVGFVQMFVIAHAWSKLDTRIFIWWCIAAFSWSGVWILSEMPFSVIGFHLTVFILSISCIQLVILWDFVRKPRWKAVLLYVAMQEVFVCIAFSDLGWPFSAMLFGALTYMAVVWCVFPTIQLNTDVRSDSAT